MFLSILEFLLISITAYLVIAGLYQLFLAISYFVTKSPVSQELSKLNKFAIIAPAHNEELLISLFCESILNVEYKHDMFDVFVIADNCNDKTEEKCSEFDVHVLSRQDTSKIGKGYALDWAMERINIEKYDSVLILDADTTVKKTILVELNKMLNNGEQAIQCYIDVPNRDESWFTQLIFLSRTINDLLYHYSKYKLGLSSYLMGTGMCFSTDLLKKMKWNAYSLSEDWEYYAKLISEGYKIGFSVDAVIHQQESSSLHQATSQRLRWASGRFYVVKSLGIKLFIDGLLRRNLQMFDASLALLLPNWSLQINLILLATILSYLLPESTIRATLISINIGLILAQGFIVLTGISLTGNPFAVFKAALLAPIFLMWKMVIDILCITKLYKGNEWIRTKRHKPD